MCIIHPIHVYQQDKGGGGGGGGGGEFQLQTTTHMWHSMVVHGIA